MDQLKAEIMILLHRWLNENKISSVRKGMAEDVEALVLRQLAAQEAEKSANKMLMSKEEGQNA